jgi:hypothetical protein
MIFLIGMPGTAEWIVVIFFFIISLILPILAIIFFVRNRNLKKQLDALTVEKNVLLSKLLDKK